MSYILAPALHAGRYLATIGLDNQLLVWDLSKAEPAAVAKHELPAPVCCGAWHPVANEIMLALASNQIWRCPDIVPTDLLPPQEAEPKPAPIPGARTRQMSRQ